MKNSTAVTAFGGSTAPHDLTTPANEAGRGERKPEPIPGPPGPQRLVLTVTEAAEVLGISRAFAYELVARGELPSIHLGRRVVIPRVQLLAFVGLGPDGALAAPDPAA